MIDFACFNNVVEQSEVEAVMDVFERVDYLPQRIENFVKTLNNNNGLESSLVAWKNHKKGEERWH